MVGRAEQLCTGVWVRRGRSVGKIERDYGAGGVQVAYEYGYNSDGARVWKRDVLNGQEYRYVCRIGCDGVSMRVYSRLTTGNEWLDCQSCCRQKGHRGVIKWR